MNEQVEEIYTQMFAPEPIPKAVKVAFDRTNFLANRIDAQLFRGTELAIIAGAATQSMPTPKPKAAQVTSEDVPIDTSEVPPGGAPSVEITEPAPDATPEQSEADRMAEQKPVEIPTTGRTGPMDAPPRPDKKRRGLAATKMLKLTTKELKVHAEQVYGWKPPTSYKKPEIIAVLKTKEPIGT